MESNLLVGLAAAALSLLFGYVPGLREWYEGLDSVRKAQVMGALLVIVAVGVFLAACYTPWQVATCSEEGAWQLVELLIMALVANQATYLIAVRPARTTAERA